MKGKPALLLTALLLAALCAACGGGGSAGADRAPVPEPESAPAAGEVSAQNGMITNSYSLSGRGTGAQVYDRADAKLIRRARLELQTTAFDQAVAALDRLTEDSGGYYESSEVQGGSYYSGGGGRWASYTVRVPREEYDAFMGKAGDVGHVVSRSETSEDVGAEYRDTELRLKTQQTKQERLLALLDKADKMEDIIDLENALTEVQYQIEQYTSTLKSYDGLVDFATIQVELSEVAKLTETTGEADPLSARIGTAFRQGLDNFGTSLGNLAVWASYHFVGVLIFAAIAVVAVLVLRRKLGWSGKKAAPPTRESGEEK